MVASRRSKPLPNDFISALADHNTPYASQLLEHVNADIPRYAMALPVLGPNPGDPPPVKLDGVLGAELAGKREKSSRRWIPKHFPDLPSKHTWQSTPVFPERETDPRKIREKATQEGVLAEQALRKLMAAQKQGGQLKGRERQIRPHRERPQAEAKKVWEEALQAILDDDAEEKRRNEESEDMAFAMAMDGATDRNATIANGSGGAAAEAAMLVNYDRKYWRKSAQGGAAPMQRIVG